jgi:hypothetical protein
VLSSATAGGDVVVLTGANFGREDASAHCASLAWSFRSTDPARTPACDGFENYLGEGEVAAANVLLWTHARIAFFVPPGMGTKDIELNVRGNVLSLSSARTSQRCVRLRYTAPAISSLAIGATGGAAGGAPLANTDGGEEFIICLFTGN